MNFRPSASPLDTLLYYGLFFRNKKKEVKNMKRNPLERKTGRYTSKYPEKVGLPVKRNRDGTYSIKIRSPLMGLPKTSFGIRKRKY